MIHQLTPEQIREITPSLRPGHSSGAGFLNETESLLEVHDADCDTLKRLLVGHEQIADKLERITAKARRMVTLAHRRGEDIWERVHKGLRVEDLFISWVSYKGYQHCPFGCDGREALSDIDYTVTDDSVQSIFFSQLHIHLLRRHHFFEGHIQYRLDPEQAVKVLGIRAGEVYTPEYKTEPIWQSGSGRSSSGMTVDDYKNEIFQSSYSSDRSMKEALMEGRRIEIPNMDEAYLHGDIIVVFHKGHAKNPEMMIDGSLLPGKEIFCECSTLHRREIRYVEP